MAGTIRGRVDCLINEADEFNNASVVFSHIYNLIQAVPSTTLVSLFYGVGGTGTDPVGGANPLGNRPFAIWRWDAAGSRTHVFYMMIAAGGITGTGAPSPTLTLENSVWPSGNGVVAVQIATGVGGSGNPYNATTNADGTDTYSLPLLQNPSGGGTNIMLAPANNRTGGSQGTNKNSFLAIVNQTSTGPMRFGIVADDDGIAAYFDNGDDGSTEETLYAGAIVANPAITYDSPCSAFKFETISLTAMRGETLGGAFPPSNADTQQGDDVGITAIGAANLISGGSNVFPDTPGGGRYSLMPVELWNNRPSRGGYRGRVDQLLRLAGNLTIYDTVDTFNWAVIAGGAAAGVLIPWDGSTAPQSSLTRDGVSFTKTI